MLWTVLGKLLGLGNGNSVISNTSGAITNLALIPVMAWCVTHASDKIQLGDISLGIVALISFFLYIILELLRRSSPHKKDAE